MSSPSKQMIDDAQQSFIDTLNNPKNRKIVMNTFIGKKGKWLGSWYLTERDMKDPDYIKEKDLPKKLEPMFRAKTKPIAFTLALSHKETFAHYVAFLYLPKKKVLYFFDPGKDIYIGYGNKMQNMVKKIINGFTIDIVDLSICGKDKCMQCTGDSFCQTWTIYFIFNYFINNNFDFIEKWKDLNALKRRKLIEEFILDILDIFPKIDAEANWELQNTYKRKDKYVYDILKKVY